MSEGDRREDSCPILNAKQELGRRKSLPCLSLSSSLLAEGEMGKWPLPADSRCDLGGLRDSLASGTPSLNEKVKQGVRGAAEKSREHPAPRLF